jgi:hypothetical protein
LPSRTSDDQAHNWYNPRLLHEKRHQRALAALSTRRATPRKDMTFFINIPVGTNWSYVQAPNAPSG